MSMESNSSAMNDVVVCANLCDDNEMKPILDHHEMNPESMDFVSQIEIIFTNKSENGEMTNLDDSELQQFFDFLLPNWHSLNHAANGLCLVKKSRAIESKIGMCILVYFISFFKDERRNLYHCFAYEILIRYMNEVSESNQKILVFESYEEMNNFTVGIINGNYRRNLRLLLHGFGHFTISSSEFQARDDEKYVQLLQHLDSERIAKFEKSLKDIIKCEKSSVGEYYKYSLKGVMTYFIQIAKMKKLLSFVELISRLFPWVGENSSLCSTLSDEQILRIFDVDDELGKDNNVRELHRLFIFWQLMNKISNTLKKVLHIYINKFDSIFTKDSFHSLSTAIRKFWMKRKA